MLPAAKARCVHGARHANDGCEEDGAVDPPYAPALRACALLGLQRDRRAPTRFVELGLQHLGCCLRVLR